MLPVSALPRTFIDQLNRSLLLRRIASQRTCSLWRIDLSGLARVDPILQCRLRCNRCSLWPERWATRCGRLHARLPGSPRAPFTPGQGYRQPFRSGHDFFRIKCFCYRQFGHTQDRCPKPDSTLPCKPAGWNMQSDSQQHQNITPPQGNSI